MPVNVRKDEFSQEAIRFQWPDGAENPHLPNAMTRAGEMLVREIARVGWELPDIDVEIDTFRAGGERIRLVRKVSGVTEDGPFELCFSGAEGRLLEATIPPGVEIRFYDDRSGPTAYLYVGRRWKADGGSFIRGAKTNAKLDGKERLYLKYSGRRGDGRILPHDDDLDREYSPRGREPTEVDAELLAAEVARFADGLRASLAALPTAPGADDVSPQGDANLRRMFEVEKVPAPEDFPLLYTWVDRNTAYRMRFKDPDDPDRTDGIPLTGWRLCPYGVRAPGLPERAHEGFTYASADPAIRAGQPIHGPRDDSMPAVLELKWINDVFVVDNAKYEQVRRMIWKEIEAAGRDEYTEAEIHRCLAAVGLTMVPAAEYAGGYVEPVYLIGRPIEGDEARLVAGTVTISVDEEKRTTQVVVTDDGTGHDFGLFEREMIGDRTSAAARRAAEDAVRFVATRRIRDLLPPPKEPEPPAPDLGAVLGL